MSHRETTLGEVVDFVRGVTFDKSQQLSTPTPSSIAVLRAGNIQVELNTATDLIFVPNNVVSPTQMLRKGDVAICLSSGSPLVVGKTAPLRSDWPGTIGGFCGIVRPRSIDPTYLALWLRGPRYLDWRDEQARGANIQNLRFSELAKLPIRLPERTEQEYVAARLTAQLAEVETARVATLGQVRDAALLRQRLFRQSFGSLHDAPHKVLGEWATTTSGSTPSRGDKRYWSPAEIPWVKTGEVAFAPIVATEEAISRQALADCSLSLLPSQTVLIAMYGQGKTRGQSAILQVDATTNQACFAILPNETWDADFLHHWLMASYDDLRSLSDGRGGNQANLNGALLNALEIPAPNITEQRRIVARLKAKLAESDAIAQAARAQLAEIERLPQQLLAQAFDERGESS